MPRPHRLKPIEVTRAELFHAYTSPPISEKGQPPTIIVTPAEPVSAQDFLVHYVSPSPSRATFFPSLSDLPTRVKTFISGPGRSPLRLESKPAVGFSGGIGLGISETKVSPLRQGATVAYNGYSPLSSGEEGGIRLSLDDEDNDSVLPTFMTRRKSHWSTSRRLRALLFIALPLAILFFHLITASMGLGFSRAAAFVGDIGDENVNANWDTVATAAAVDADVEAIVAETLAARNLFTGTLEKAL